MLTPACGAAGMGKDGRLPDLPATPSMEAHVKRLCVRLDCLVLFEPELNLNILTSSDPFERS
jgi:hypothetical protein